MGATNTTTNYDLSQFVSTDKPAWLQDYNGDMAKIDAAIAAAKTAADTAQNTANSANTGVGQNTSDITALQTAVSAMNASITNMAGAINTITSLIGNGTPTTTDQTIIGAINEINANLNGTMLDNNAISLSNVSIPVNSYFTAPADGTYFFDMTGSAAATAVFYADANRSIVLASAYTGMNNVPFSVSMKQGAKIYTRAESGPSYRALSYIPF